MTVFQLAALLVSLAALFSYLNYKLLKLPTAIGATALALGASLALVLIGLVVPGVEQQAAAWWPSSTSTKPSSRACSGSCCSPARCTST